MGTTVAAWILILTMNSVSAPQFVYFSTQQTCEAARSHLIERYTMNHHTPAARVGILAGSAIAAEAERKVFAATESVCKPG